ncbi:E2F-associated phospho protein [Glomus cerebriforme]|uniref:E2F-associated phospho protein n=1 Tax=Glomus cerebriforme TaxID=658196 RepID=A0A397TBA0_9GLOM|nr:E2F-associated phospho protein [Glomus cerebriforme]
MSDVYKSLKIAMSSSKTLPIINNDDITDNEEKYYDKLYFDSDTTDEEKTEVSSKESKKVLKPEQRKKLTNDELLYDPELDTQDELWMEKKLSQYSSKAKQISTSKLSEIPGGTDAILSCPLCFTPLSYHTQRHELYSNQYRAIFVENCKIIKTERLLYNENKLKNKKRQNKKEESSNEQIIKQEYYYPVECEICGTKVAVMDEEEVFHFFNAIPS